MNLKQLKTASQICFFLGFASIVASIAIWYLTGGTEPESQAHAERFGIFVGLWAPTFFILSNRFDRFSEKSWSDWTPAAKLVWTQANHPAMDNKDMIKMCGGVDYVTQDMAITLLAGEEDHRREFLGFLTEYEQAQVCLTQC
jgi:hypothetical protein